MRPAALLVGIALLAACSDDATDPEVPIFHGEFGSVLSVQEDGVGIEVLDGMLGGQPVEEDFHLFVTGTFRDEWGNVYEPDDLLVGTAISGHAENCFGIDVLVCAADYVIVHLPIAVGGTSPR